MEIEDSNNEDSEEEYGEAEEEYEEVKEEIEESVIVQKILRSLPMTFNPKISALEERSDLDSISMAELHGIFTAYEMRTEHGNLDVKEVAFKASKRSKKKKKEQEEYSSNNDVSEDDEEVTNFVKRLNKGTNGRYRGKLPFNCDGIGHFFIIFRDVVVATIFFLFLFLLL